MDTYFITKEIGALTCTHDLEVVTYNTQIGLQQGPGDWLTCDRPFGVYLDNLAGLNELKKNSGKDEGLGKFLHKVVTKEDIEKELTPPPGDESSEDTQDDELSDDTLGVEASEPLDGEVVQEMSLLDKDGFTKLELDYMYDSRGLVKYGAGKCRDIFKSLKCRKDTSHKMKGAMSTTIGRYTNLEQIDFYKRGVSISGQLPSEMGLLTKLKYL
jgi:hypothetical protein